MTDKMKALVEAVRKFAGLLPPHQAGCGVRETDRCDCWVRDYLALSDALDALDAFAAFDAEPEVANEKDAILLDNDDAVKLVPSTMEEAMQQNERLKAIIRAHEKTARTKAVSAELVLLPDPGIAWRFVLCAPGCDEAALLDRARLELDRLANAFFKILAADETARGES